VHIVFPISRKKNTIISAHKITKEKSENEKRRNKTLAQVKSLARRFISGLSLSPMLGEKGESFICSIVPQNTAIYRIYMYNLAKRLFSNPRRHEHI
jgi:hypothetical protein